MHFKTIEDYLNAVTLNGFEVISFTEARVRAEDMANNSPFFSDVNGYPLHIVMKVRKPTSTSKSVALGAMNTLDILPKKLNWPRTVPNNVENSLVMQLTSAANNELTDAALQVYDKGISVDDLDIGSFFVGKEFSATKTFASSVRNRLLHETGAVIIKGLDMSVLGGADQLDKMTACSKIAYLLICEHIGSVDATSRGKLFDVKRYMICMMCARFRLPRASIILKLLCSLLSASIQVPTLMRCQKQLTMFSSQFQIPKVNYTSFI